MRVLLADDNVLFLEGLGNLLNAAGIDVAGTARSGREAVRKAIELKPDVVMMDIRMPDVGGIEATRQIRDGCPGIKVVMLTVCEDDVQLFAAIKAGASGYLLKGMATEELLALLRGIESGDCPLSPGLAAKILAEFVKVENERAAMAEAVAKTALLTPRHIEILRQVASGLTYRKIGDRLGVSAATVKYHMGEITARLQLDNKSQVIAFAGKLGLPLDEKK
jgi:Response regulator containing a CheY-like receiver domain and an HTH DNA-binding domain